MKILMVIILIFFSAPCYAQDSTAKKTMPLDEVEKLRLMLTTLKELKEMESADKKNENKILYECETSTGDSKLCKCLNDKLPWVLNFAGYANIVTHTRDELGYSKMDKDLKGVVDATRKARDECVYVH